MSPTDADRVDLRSLLPLAGDGVLAVFTSARQAIEAADFEIEVWRGLEPNRPRLGTFWVSPEMPTTLLRMSAPR